MALATVGTLAVAAAPASADVNEGYVTGTGTWTDDWADEGPISEATHSYNNVVAAWQMMLYADGYFPQWAIDCGFGPTTTAATKRWQAAHGLVSDGIVGPETFAKAATKLSVYEGEGWFYYDGRGDRFAYFGRDADGKWDMSLGPDLEWQTLTYTEATFSICS
ncbi:peptidoglycan-binding protein [Micromonospora sp. STR1_7]|uniref:Peptidoglycan-binding protein n=2 Tax=Micromonospora parastrephiae TaxID=2806101 RepID=A0ABS1XQM6_9ACTN|nr:peptidoglycan-binding protein [Micromonospora parastrephiae]